MAKRTPFPWVPFDTFNDGWCVISGARHVCSVDGGLTEDECQANAKLIAAAPDLFAALREVFQLPFSLRQPDRHVVIGRALHDRIRKLVTNLEEDE
jgi:hypothetical protein